jgi:hypothetical protein
MLRFWLAHVSDIRLLMGKENFWHLNDRWEKEIMVDSRWDDNPN